MVLAERDLQRSLSTHHLAEILAKDFGGYHLATEGQDGTRTVLHSQHCSLTPVPPVMTSLSEREYWGHLGGSEG